MSSRKQDISDELFSRLSANYQKLEDLIGENGPLKLLVENVPSAEMSEHLGRAK